jgi:hypothetical protein
MTAACTASGNSIPVSACGPTGAIWRQPASGLRIPTVKAPWNLAEFEQAMEKLAAVEGVEYPLSLGFHVGTSEFYS